MRLHPLKLLSQNRDADLQNRPERFILLFQAVSVNNLRLSHDPGVRTVRSGGDSRLTLRIMGRGLQPGSDLHLEHGLPGIEPHVFVSRGLAR